MLQKANAHAGGFEELDHTADLRVRIWAADLNGLFAWAGRAMVALCGLRCEPAPHISFSLFLDEDDLESRLVVFLSDLLYACEARRCCPVDLRVAMHAGALEAVVEALPLRSQERQIKAVTYHDLRIWQAQDCWQATVVFDV